MTLKEFFEIARNVKWIVNRDGQVRTKSRFKNALRDAGAPPQRMCPLAYVTKGQWGPETAASELGIGPRTAFRIAHAADYANSRGRARLLKNLGIGR